MKVSTDPINNLKPKSPRAQRAFHYPKCQKCGTVLTIGDMCADCLGENADPIQRRVFGTTKFYWEGK